MGPFAIDTGLLFWTLVTFIALVFLLARFTFKPLTRLTEERERNIRESLEKAETARDQAQELLDLNEKRLSEAREEARRIINEGHRIVAQMKREAAERSQEDAEAVINQARAEIEGEVQRSLSELKTTVANLSLRITRQVIRDDMTDERHEQLASDFIERLKKSHARR